MQLLPNGKQQFLYGNGTPLAGGSVYFYLPNTSTPATTYQDTNGTTPNTNPVVLDANGQAVIYGSGTYRQVVKDPSGVVIWDQLTATTSTQTPYADDNGQSNVYTIAMNPAVQAYVEGQLYYFKATNANTGASTLNINGVGTVAIVHRDGSPLLAGDITANSICEVVFDGANFILMGVGITQPQADARYPKKSGDTFTGQVTFNQNITLPSLNGGPLAGSRNRIINGNFAINQRSYVSGTALTAGAYGHDRWKAGASGLTYTFTQGSPDTTITITAGTAVQVIEGANIEGGSFTVSWTGTAQCRVNGGTYAASPVKVTGLTAGANVTIEFNTGTLGNVQFEPGAVATPFERRFVSQELAMCLRYFYAMPLSISLQGYSSSTGANTYQTLSFPVPMRASPTATANWSSGTRNASQNVVNLSMTGCQLQVTSNASGDFGVTYNSGNSFSAEL